MKRKIPFLDRNPFDRSRRRPGSLPGIGCAGPDEADQARELPRDRETAYSLTVAWTPSPDTTPPTTPTDLREQHYDGSDTEINLWWTQSTADLDPQSSIRYDVHVNGELQDILFGSGGRSIVYGVQAKT